LRAFDKGYLIHIHIYWMTGDGRQPLPFCHAPLRENPTSKRPIYSASCGLR
jgi:hypothetical protein